MLIFIMVFHDTARKMYNNHVTQRVFLSVCYVWVFVLIWHADLFQCRNCSVLTPHTTWQIHPADRSLFRSLKHHWTEEGLKTARQHAAMKLKQEFLKVLATAWRRSATVKNALSGLCSTGLFPFNPKQIPDDAFLLSSPQKGPCQYLMSLCRHG